MEGEGEGQQADDAAHPRRTGRVSDLGHAREKPVTQRNFPGPRIAQDRGEQVLEGDETDPGREQVAERLGHGRAAPGGERDGEGQQEHRARQRDSNGGNVAAEAPEPGKIPVPAAGRTVVERGARARLDLPQRRKTGLSHYGNSEKTHPFHPFSNFLK